AGRGGSVAGAGRFLLALQAALLGLAGALDLLALAFVLDAPRLELLAVALALLGRGGVLHAALAARPVRLHPTAVVLQRQAMPLGGGAAAGVQLLLAGLLR